MAFVQLKIVEPTDGLPVVGSDAVVFRGEVVTMPDAARGRTLYYRWYSSLYEPVWDDPGHPDYYAIDRNRQSRPDEPFTWRPGVGSHVITFAVSDRETETREDFEAIEHGGVTGGDEGEDRCLLHVFLAELLVPAPPSGVVSLSGSADSNGFALVARAPSQWANDRYQEHNRLGYRFLFDPIGPPAGRGFVPLLPQADQLEFTRFGADSVPAVGYSAPLPGTLWLGSQYLLTLFVEDKDDPSAARHQVAVPVGIVP
jgi:hypothetical protein